MIRFLHAADLHVDSPMRGLPDYEGAPIERVRAATRKATENLINLAIAEQVQFVLLAGDLYDQDRQDFNTARFLVAELAKLAKAGIPAYIVRGNHDASARITRSLQWPDGVREFKDNKAESHPVPGLPVVLHGRSYPKGAVEDVEFARGYPQAVAGQVNIGVLHTCAQPQGGKVDGHDPYAPCSVSELAAKGYDYWALGHVHTRQTLQTQPTIAFPGNIQGRHVNEPGARGCLVVQLEEGGPDGRRDVLCEFQPLDDVRWTTAVADVSGASTFQSAVERALAAVGAAVDCADGRLLACRVLLTGETAAHAEIAADKQRLVEELRSRCQLDLGDRAYLEKIVVRTRMPAQALVRGANALLDAITGMQTHEQSAQLLAEALTTTREQLAPLREKILQTLSQQEANLPDLDDKAQLDQLIVDAHGLLRHRIAGLAAKKAA